MLPDAMLVSMGPERPKVSEDCIILGQHPDVDCMDQTSDEANTRDQDVSKRQAHLHLVETNHDDLAVNAQFKRVLTGLA
ncbi:uncharacterized protein N7503_009728 [Penicillium pulvis]|uniref:uncharacterized protein n=1 Tax=Penicillium pulvis TaxID=1562058 RepID=UPI0025476E36|nr:uncharacterized protein N7503_009728 [Penicillium pulvis]KAJ5784516.1 hypothetical protein N7503_009728 [Penicillium pulvis]